MGIGLKWLGLSVHFARRPNCIWVDLDHTFDLAFKELQMSGQFNYLIKRNTAIKLGEGNLHVFVHMPAIGDLLLDIILVAKIP